jgi:CRP/FNR family cyclic AMP-dependent transcriptional regulator
MNTKSFSQVPQDTYDYLLAGVPFFKMVKQDDPAQYQTLLRASNLQTYQSGDVVVRRGDEGNWLYFLLKGKLAVYADEALQGSLINYVTPGEVFGDLAQLVGAPRTATVIADSSAKESIVLALDCNIFGPLECFTPISLATKLTYYRNTAHHLRWKLEVYRAQYLQHPLANKHRQIKLYLGEKDTVDELKSLFSQSKLLAGLLVEWNETLTEMQV